MRFKTLFLIVFILVSNWVFSQKEDIKFEHLSMKDGLSMNPIMSITQDKKGFLWFGTPDGLNRYDGYGFSVFKSINNDSLSISDNFITTQCIDKNGDLWVGTLNGLNKYDSKTGNFKRFNETNSNFLSTKIYCLYADKQGLVWVGTEKGIAIYDLKSQKFANLKSNYSVLNPLLQTTVLCVFQDKENVLWFGTTQGLYVFSESKLFFFDSKKNGLSNNLVLSIYQDKSNTMWVGTLDGLNKFDKKTKIFSAQFFKNAIAETRNISLTSSSIFSIVNNYGGNTIRCINEDNEGWLWVGTDMELIIFNPRTSEFINYKKDLLNPNGLNDHFIRSMYVDNSANLWIGTLGSGLNKVNLKPTKFNLFQKKADGEKSISENYVRAICEDTSGVIWIGALVGGLTKYDSKTNTYKHFKSNGTSNSICENNIWSLCYDKSINSIWIGTNNGLDLYDIKKNSFKHFVYSANNKNSISNNTVRTIFIDRKNNVWFGTEGGLNKFDRKHQSFAYYSKDNSSISNNTVWKIAQDKTDKLWLATDDGLNSFDVKTEKFTIFTKNNLNENSLSHNGLRTVYADNNDFLWIGTQNGLNKLNLKNLTFTEYNEKDGLPNPFIYAIVEDDLGKLWISTNKGIAEFDKIKTFKNYDIYDGLQDYEFNTNASFKASNGDIYFGGPSGLNKFNPSKIKPDLFAAPVVITAIKILDKPYVLKDVSELTEIKLHYDENIINISFASLDYTNPSRNKYMYKLEGFKEQWINAEYEHLISYTNLDPGNYTLLIKGSNSDGVWNEIPTQLRIIISPPFWKTWWFYLLCFTFVVVGVYVFVTNRIKRLIKTKKILETKVKERTKEVEVQKNELSQKNKDLTDSINYAKRIQNSILPSDDLFSEYFSDSFILYKPRDIVSGDFYWLSQVRTSDERNLNLKIIAAVDCTGHGVPGAFMSLIASDLLNQTIKNPDVNTPGDVLNFLNKNLPIALNKNNAQKINDGMDIAVCAIDMNNNKLYYSGANRPLWVINSANLFSEIKANKVPVGGHTDAEFNFESHALEFEKGDTLYLFSDGFADQFGGLKNKKIGTKNLKELITKYAAFSLEEQKQKLNDFFESWKGNNDQTDDVLLMAIKM